MISTYSQKGLPVLFIPGHMGSSGQARSLGHVFATENFDVGRANDMTHCF